MQGFRAVRSSSFGVLVLTTALATTLGCGGGGDVRKFGGGETGGHPFGTGGYSSDSSGGSGGVGLGFGGETGEGGLVGTGGVDATGGSGDGDATGGASNTGGVPGAGGARSGGRGGMTMGSGGGPATGGRIGTGGVIGSGTGGRVTTGGTVGTGGIVFGSGGAFASGGNVGSGGAVSSGGVTGTGGVSGTGGGTQATCDQIAADYEREMSNAKMCAGLLRATCTIQVPRALGCPKECKTYVDDDKGLNLISDKWTAAGCDNIIRKCPLPLCPVISGAKCVSSGTLLNGMCQDITGVATASAAP
jgi:hypothetical protein